MANIYVSPLLSPSLERLSNSTVPQIEIPSMEVNGLQRIEQQGEDDENANVFTADSWEKRTDRNEANGIETQKGWNAVQSKQDEAVQNYLQDASCNGSIRKNGENMAPVCSEVKHHEADDDVITSTAAKTSLEVQLSPASRSYGLNRSPVYCFHSFTYGVAGSNDNLCDESKVLAPSSSSSSWANETFDADSPKVQFTRTVVELEDTGSPTILLDWNPEELGECLQSETVLFQETNSHLTEGFQSEIYVKLSNKANNTPCKIVVTPDRQTSNLQERNGAADEDETSHSLEERRMSPDGAECDAVNTSGGGRGTKGYCLVPGKSFLAEGERVGRVISETPSGVLTNSSNWIWEDVFESKDSVDSDYLPGREQVPLLRSGKTPVWYTNEAGSEEVEDETPVSCLSCFRCVIL